MTTTTTYGTWTNCVNTYSTSPEADIIDYITGGDADWRDRMESTGALDAIAAEYRRAIDVALPFEIALCGTEFIGPAYPDAEDQAAWRDYPRDESGCLDFRAAIEEIDLAAIIEKHDVDA